MKNNNSDFDETKFFDFDAEQNDDPYERGFADKLYDEYDDDEINNVYNGNADFDDYDDYTEEPEEYVYEEPSAPPVQQPQYRPRKVNPYQQVYNPRKKNQFQQEYTPRPQKSYNPAPYEEYDQPRQPRRKPKKQAYVPQRPKAEPRRTQAEYAEERPRKKHSFLGFIFKFILIVLILLVSAALILHFLAKPPKGNENLGAHLDDSCTILLAGTDESGDRTDTIMLMNINRASGQISLMSIPRDTKVNSTYTPHQINIAYGVNGKGEEGMDSLMDYVSDCVGFRPDGYILLELDVFMDLVDLLGGVDFDVPMDMFYEDASQDLFIDLKEGLQTLDGEAAMELVRYRYGYADADLGRVSVQRNFMLSAIDQWVSLKNVWKAPAAFGMLKAKATTDLSLLNFIWIAESVLSCGTDDMYMTTIPFYFSDQYLIVDAGENYLNMINTYFNPYSENVTWDDLYIAY